MNERETWWSEAVMQTSISIGGSGSEHRIFGAASLALALAVLPGCGAAKTDAGTPPVAAPRAHSETEGMTATTGQQKVGRQANLPPRVRALREKKLSDKCPPGMVYVPSGRFTMGSIGNEPEWLLEFPLWGVDDAGDPFDYGDKPAHSVTVAAFCIDLTPVSVAEYEACVGDGRCPAAPRADAAKRDLAYCNTGRADRAEHYVNCVDWNAADAFCRAQGKRLPSEVEWEFSARGTDGRTTPSGRDRSEIRTCRDNHAADEATCPVGMFSETSSAFGLLDQEATAEEWTASPFCAYPQHNCSAATRATRGTTYGYPYGAVLTHRRGRRPNEQDHGITFRCASPPGESRNGP